MATRGADKPSQGGECLQHSKSVKVPSTLSRSSEHFKSVQCPKLSRIHRAFLFLSFKSVNMSTGAPRRQVTRKHCVDQLQPNFLCRRSVMPSPVMCRPPNRTLQHSNETPHQLPQVLSYCLTTRQKQDVRISGKPST